jgi:hypothetical protein
VPQKERSMPKASIEKASVCALLEESKGLDESLCFNKQRLAALIRCNQRRRRQLRRAVAQRQRARCRQGPGGCSVTLINRPSSKAQGTKLRRSSESIKR